MGLQLNSYKVCLVGNTGVGKSSLVDKVVYNRKSENTRATIGAAFNVLFTDENKYEIWDTAGQERYRSLAPMYYRDSDIIILVFDLTSIESLKSLTSWQSEIMKINDTAQIIVIGNKSDMYQKQIKHNQNMINKEMIEKYVSEISCVKYIETNIYDTSTNNILDEMENIAEMQNKIRKNKKSNNISTVKIDNGNIFRNGLNYFLSMC